VNWHKEAPVTTVSNGLNHKAPNDWGKDAAVSPGLIVVWQPQNVKSQKNHQKVQN